MVLLLSALAVIAAAVLLVAWFVVGGGFGLIYTAMALAVASMVLLWVARWIGSTSMPEGALAPAPLAEDLRVEVPVRGEIDGSAHRSFPIPDYEHLWVTQILPLVPDLDKDELAMVEARERGSRNRRGILDAIAAERATRAGLSVAATDDERVETEVLQADEADVVEREVAEAGVVADSDDTSDATDVAVVGVAGDVTEDDDEAAAFERAWNQLTAIDELEELAQLDPPRRERSLFARGWALEEADGDDRSPGVDGDADGAVVLGSGESDGPGPEAIDASNDVEGDGSQPEIASGGPRVRTFLGRVSSPIRVERPS